MTPTSDDPGNEPSTFGRYELSEVLGRGGMGEVWRAHDTRHDHDVALKLLAPQWSDNPEFRRRFQREAAATAALDSPHVIPIHDHGEIDGRLYLAMPLITGADLGTLITAHPDGLDPNQAVTLTGQIAAALTAAHHAGLIHRDVKPANILLDADGPSADHAYLVDFGIARIADDTRDTPLTATGDTLGTPAYMAPELFTAAEATVASDVYALGCVLFELLTGHRPYQAPTTTALIAQHLYEPIPHPSDSNPTLATYDAVITRTLAKTPDQRYPTTHTLIQALRHTQNREQTQNRQQTQNDRQTRTAATATGEGTATASSGAADSTSTGPGENAEHEHPRQLGSAGDSPRTHSPWPRSRRGRLIALLVVLLLVVGGVTGGLAWSRYDDADSGPDTTPTAATGPVPARVPSLGGESVAFSPDSRRAYVTQTDVAALSVIDTRSGNEIARIPTPEGWGGVAVSPDGSRVYVTSFRSFENPGTRLTVIDAATNSVIGTVAAGSNAQGVAVSADSRLVYSVNFGTIAVPGSTVSVIDSASRRLVGQIPVGVQPEAICTSVDGRVLYVPDLGLGDPKTATVTRIDTTTGQTTDLRVGAAAPEDCAISPDGRHLWVSALGPPRTSRGDVQLVDTATGQIAGVDPGAFAVPNTVSLTPDGRLLLVPDTGPDNAPRHTITMIDTTTSGPERTLTLPCRPLKVAPRPDGKEAWVTCENPLALWRIPL
jgi:serine/threonine protein kinase, bacterial